ncbi:MAG TPA: hypothetical protein VHZ24_22155 [Pirellulales bacterium]|jgi:hypothetical protein|nr:hypothetical protein [Pirellulales bacterium]
MILAARALRSLEGAAAARQWPEFSQLWLQHRALIESLPAANHCRQRFETLEAAERLEAMLDDPRSDEAVIAALWQQLLRDGEPPLADRLHAARERRRQRQENFVQINGLLAAMSEAPTFAADQQLRHLWKCAESLGDSRLETLRGHYRLAKLRMKRMRWLNRLAQAPTFAGEQQIAACLRYLPSNYHAKLPQRIALARQRLEAMRVLETAALEPVSERRLLAAWADVVAAKGQALVTAERAERVALAQRRAARIVAIDALRSLPPDERDQRVLELWDESLLAGCNDAAQVQPLRDEATARAAAIGRLAEALELGDGDEIAAARTDACLCDYPLPDELRSRLAAHDERLRQARIERRHALVQAVLDHDLARFRELFDCELVADLCSHVPHHQRIVSDWVEREILPLTKSGLACAADDGLRWAGPHTCQARWTWPAASITNRSVLAVLREMPAHNAIPSDLSPLCTVEVPRRTSPGAAPAIELSVDPQWHPAHVFVWAVVALGYQTFFSEPLNLGQLRPPDQ